MLGWKTCKYYHETDELPSPRPTQPKKKGLKSAIWATISNTVDTRADLSLGRWPAANTCFFSGRTAYSVSSLALWRGPCLAARDNRRVMATNYRVVDRYQSMEEQP